MFERFTDRARQVVVFAQDEARMVRHDYIGTEHILLGLLREDDGVAARVLDSLGITADRVRSEVARYAGQGDVVSTGQIPFTARAKRALELALREGLALGSRSIGTEHLLLGLVRGNDGVAVRILDDLDADPATIRERVIAMLGTPTTAPGPRPRLLTDIDAGRQPSAMSAPDPFRSALRFARGCRSALRFAQEEARALNHAQMGTEHILLGLIREQHGLAARLLGALGITIDDARAHIVAITGTGTETTTGHLAFTPQAKHALERARREAFARKSEWVDTEHLLLGILRQDGIAGLIVREPTS
jgi:ATP-dependent Clp protease ATP-binding subunit ClpA